MKMDKLFAGLIAFVAGVALSAGSAFAQTNGYVGGDYAQMKLVPYFETGGMKATIVAIQNLSPQQQDTKNKNADVTNIESFLAGNTLGGDSPTAAQTRAIGLINGKFSGTDITGSTKLDPATQLNLKAAAEAALADANKAKYTEHVFVTVNVYDGMDMMMGSTRLCLDEDQFGYVILQGPEMQDWQDMDSHQNKILSVMAEDIPEYGYVKVMAGGGKFQSCDSTDPTEGIKRVDTRPAGTGEGQLGQDGGSPVYTGADSKLATWAIVQDTGMGFFGTEVPTSTISMAKNRGATAAATDDGKLELACYSHLSNDGTSSPSDTLNVTPNTTGDFMMSRCGLIPERHTIILTGTAPNRTLDKVGSADTAGDSSTMNTNAIARYDIGDETMVYVWLAKGMDTTATKPSQRRMLDVVVQCEDGTAQMKPGVDPGQMGPIKVAAPHRLTMIDPSMGDVGMYTNMCDEGERGVLKITMPDNSHAGMVFTHITQMMGHYRMNFPGYSMAEDVEIDTASGG